MHEQVIEASSWRAEVPVASATLAAHDPSYDPPGRMRHTALALRALLAREARLAPV